LTAQAEEDPSEHVGAGLMKALAAPPPPKEGEGGGGGVIYAPFITTASTLSCFIGPK